MSTHPIFRLLVVRSDGAVHPLGERPRPARFRVVEPGAFRVSFSPGIGAFVAQVVEASVEKDGTPRVHRVVCAVDCGRVVNPDGVKAQVEGAIIFGLTAAQNTEITFKNGRVQQSNFDDYPMVRMSEAPEIEVHIVPSEQPPTGVGEPGVPPVAPALANALFTVTGHRIRRLPMRASDLLGKSEVAS